MTAAPTTGSNRPTFPRFEPVAEPTARWVRVKFGGQTIADSKQALLLLQYGPGRLPTYYFPQADVKMDLLESGATQNHTEGFEYRTVKAGDNIAEKAAWIYRQPPASLAALKDYVSFDWPKMDAWFEEEEEIYEHARDPHHRVDVMPSSRHVQIRVKGVTVADTHRPSLLFETTLPVRYYIPREDIKWDLMVSEELHTRCPYKGLASYWSVQVDDKKIKNIAWSYPEPIPECPKIKELVAFFNERVDLYVDGELQPRPLSPWSGSSE